MAGAPKTSKSTGACRIAPARRSARLKLAAASQELHNVRIDCPRLELSVRAIACERARVAAKWPVIGAQSFTARLVYGRSDGSLEVAAEGIRLGDGKVALTASLRGGAWTFDVSAADVTLNNESGSLATDKLSARLRGTARQSAAATGSSLSM